MVEACHIVAVVVVRHTAYAVEGEVEVEMETKHIHTDPEERTLAFVVVEMDSQGR